MNYLPQCIDNKCELFRNVCHGSDSVESAEKEISLWFKPEEIVEWTSCQNDFVYE